MAILVTGATGFLGRRLVALLTEQGGEVVAVTRQRGSRTAELSGVRWVECDLATGSLSDTDLAGVTTVVHLAGATLGAGTDEMRFLQANEQTTVRLLQATAPRVDRVIFASSQVVYGDAQNLAVTEAFPLRPDASAYACSKVNAENWLRWFQRRHGGVYVALRLCGFIDGGGLVDYIVDRTLAGEPISLRARGQVRRDYLPSRDGVEAIARAVDFPCDPGFTVINVGSGQAVTALELAEAVRSELHANNVIEYSSDSAPQGDFCFSIARAQALLGFQPSSLVEAVRRYARMRRGEMLMKESHA